MDGAGKGIFLPIVGDTHDVQMGHNVDSLSRSPGGGKGGPVIFCDLKALLPAKLLHVTKRAIHGNTVGRFRACAFGVVHGWDLHQSGKLPLMCLPNLPVI